LSEFAPKTWVIEKKPLGPPADAKKVTPLGKGLNDLEERIEAGFANVRVSKEAPINVEHPEYGADGTGVSASDAAFAKAIAALPSEGGAILAPRRYKLSSKLNADKTRSVRIVGQSALTAGNTGASQLLFTQGGTEALISARSSVGFGLQDLGIFYNNGSFTGPALDLSHAEGSGDGAYDTFERCNFVGQGVRTALGVDLDKAIAMAFRDVYFNNFDVDVRGMKTAGSYSNAHLFDHCIFAGTKTIPLLNGGEAWGLRNCIFENLNGGGAGAFLVEEGFSAIGMCFDTCWFGDATTGSGTWITFRGQQLAVRHGALGGGGLGVFLPDASTDGLYVEAVEFINITDAIRANWSGGGNKNYVINPNGYSGVAGKKVSLDNGATDLGVARHIGGNGLTLGGDVALSRAEASVAALYGQLRILGASGGVSLGIRQPADESARFRVLETGEMQMGDGTLAGLDTNLYRSAADQLKTDDQLVVVGGMVPNAASAASKATVSLAAGFPTLVEITGTTEVKKITATAKGHRVTLLFEKALTVKNGENLKLGADFAATAGSTLTLVCDGSNWYPA
jgi:hypothetical protein